MRAVASTCSNGETFLHDAVFAGMVRQYGDAATWNGVLDGLIECIGKHIELAIDLDPNS